MKFSESTSIGLGKIEGQIVSKIAYEVLEFRNLSDFSRILEIIPEISRISKISEVCRNS